MRLVGVLVGPALLAFAIVTALSQVLPEPRTEPFAEATGLAWGGRVFTSRAEFALWLAERGQSYATWERRHPGSYWSEAGSKAEPSADASGPAENEASLSPGAVAILGATIVLVIGVATFGLALIIRSAPRTLELGVRSAAVARPRLTSAGLAVRRELDVARPRLESAAVAARRGVEAAGPRLAEAGATARQRVEAAAVETADAGMSFRYAVATGRYRGPLTYALAAVLSAALGLGTAVLLLLMLGEL